MTIKCLIIDDEPPARALIASYLSRLDNFEICGEFGNALEAFKWLQNNEADLMLLDIQMPNMNGMELLNSLIRPPQAILTTAYREYAVEGFELGVLDYLVKPISFERFMKAIGKYHNFYLAPTVKVAAENTFINAYIFIKVEKHQVKVWLKEIIYIESIKDYLKIVTEKKTYITYHRLSSMEEKLPEECFVRIHKSYIIAMNKILSFRNEKVIFEQKELPVGRLFRKKFLSAYKSDKH